VSARNSQQILIILHASTSVGSGNSLINSPTELQYLELVLMFKVSTRTRTNSSLFGNLNCNVFFQVSVRPHKKCMLYLLQC